LSITGIGLPAMIDLFENCLALVAGLCVNTTTDAHLISASDMRGASMEIAGVSVTATLRTDSFPYPDRRRMARYCAQGTCIFYHFWCGSREDRYRCALHYNEVDDRHNRIVEFSGPSAPAVDRVVQGIRLVTRNGSSLLPLAMLDRRSQSSIPPYCRPETDRGCGDGVSSAWASAGISIPGGVPSDEVTAAWTGGCVSTAQQVTLQGQVRYESVFGPPGFGESPRVDQRRSIPVLALDNPIDICPGANEEIDTAPIRGVRRVQLIGAPGNDRRLSGRVFLIGELQRGTNAIHYPPVTLVVRQRY
jgi:hypothetical protein